MNLLDASDPSVRPPDPADFAQWISDTDSDATDVQTDHHFNRRREGQGEPEFFEEIREEFIGTGTNEADLRRYDLFGFFFTQAGPRVLSQVAILPTPDFSADAPTHGGPSEAELAERWATWEILVHEHFHTLAHPAFSRAAAGNRILTEGFCELFTKAVLDGAVTIEIQDATPADGDVLDRPEATLDSQLGPEWRQEVYASRGLVLHRRDDDVALLYGVGRAPSTTGCPIRCATAGHRLANAGPAERESRRTEPRAPR